jgi:hypothetical protein
VHWLSFVRSNYYIFALYEADHQWVYLNRVGVADAVLPCGGDVAVDTKK